MRSLRVGLAGLGTVGQSLVRLLRENQVEIERNAGMRIEIVRVVSRTPKPEVDIGDATFSTDINSLLSEDVDVVVELIGGTETAWDIAKGVLATHKPFVTANKAMLAEYGNDIFDGHTQVGFEAAVAGGIPIISGLRTGVSGNKIDWIAGIINGTSNYIITSMEEEGKLFEEALEDAQRLGYAEADPSFDIDGIDAGQKLAILAAIAFGIPISMAGIHMEGISQIEVEDLQYARELGFRIKHLGVAKQTANGTQLSVHPALVSETQLLAQVEGVTNAVLIGANAVGSLMFVGPGAGGSSTASSVISDLVEVARGTMITAQFGHVSQKYISIEETESCFYLNIPAVDRAGVFAEVAEILSREGISIESVIQKSQATRKNNGETWVPIVILTNLVLEETMESAQNELQKSASVVGPIRRIRVSQFNL